jgi:predicted DNA-binding protein
MREAIPERLRARHIRDTIEVYINDEGDLYFG